MMRTRQLAVMASVSLVCVWLWRPAAAHATTCSTNGACNVYGPFCEDIGGTVHLLYVYLDDLDHDGKFASMPIAEVENQVRIDVDLMNAGHGADILLVYKGIVTDPTDPGPSDNIFIQDAGISCGCSSPAVACTDYGFSILGNVISATIWIEDSVVCWPPEANSNSVFASYGTETGAPYRFNIGGIILHELAHALGEDHPSACSQCTFFSCATTDESIGTTNRMRNIRRWDSTQLIKLYGQRNKTPLFKESLDALTWATGTPAVPTTWTPAFPLGSVTSDEGVVAFSWSPASDFRVRFGKGDNAGWFFTTTTGVNNDLTWDPVGTAVADGGVTQFVLAYTADEGMETNFHMFNVARSTNAGSTWTTVRMSNGTPDPPGLRSVREGVTAHHDPTSGRFLVSWLDESDRINVFTYVSGATGVNNVLGDQAIDAASIACRAGQGIRNCVMVWAGVDGYGCLNTLPFSVNATGTLTLGTKQTGQCYVLSAGPSVTHQQSSATYPFKLTFKQQIDGSSIKDKVFTFRRGPNTTDLWVDQRTLVSGQWVWPPAVGTLVNGTEEIDAFYTTL